MVPNPTRVGAGADCRLRLRRRAGGHDGPGRDDSTGRDNGSGRDDRACGYDSAGGHHAVRPDRTHRGAADIHAYARAHQGRRDDP